MRKLNNFVKSACAAAAVVLMTTQCTPKQAPVAAVASTGTEAMTILPIAYVNIDSLLTRYDFVKVESEKLLKKGENSRVAINEKGKKLENEVKEFQRKIQNNAFLSEQRAQQEAQRIQKLEQELQEYSARLSNELGVEEQKMHVAISDSVNNIIKIYNAQKNYQMILSTQTGGPVLIADPRYDITSEIVNLLNSRYNKK